MTLTRLLLYVGLFAAVMLGINAIRARDVAKGDTQGAARVMAQWNAQKAVDQDKTLQLERERRADELTGFRNAERINDEQAKRETTRERRIAAGNAVADQLRSAIDRLNRRDVSQAGSDPRAVALAQEAATARELFGSCNKAQLGVAAEADGLRDQVVGLQDFVKKVCHSSASGSILKELEAVDAR